MCGIAGIINFKGRPVLQEELKKMTDAIAHRGPDGEGFFIDEAVGFGHRRLSIIDLSDAAAQPMTRFGLTITYNGEIYNYIELRKELESAGYAFISKSDTEVILAAYHYWGKDCVQRFNGMWAFAIYDAANKEVFLSRDRFGEKPLYYSYSAKQLLLSSEIKGLLAIADRCRPNEEMVAAFLVDGFCEHREQTFFKGILKLPAGTNLIVSLVNGSAVATQYYTPHANAFAINTTEDEVVTQLTSLLSESVRLRLRSDVGVGSCLSGGTDSSLIVAHMKPFFASQTVGRFKAITATSADMSVNEERYAGMVARHCELNWKTVEPSAEMYFDSLEQLVKVQEEPFVSASIAMQFFVMQLAKKEGLSVLLDGQGADELFLGYSSYWPAKLNWNGSGTNWRFLHQVMKNNSISPSLMAKLWLRPKLSGLKMKVDHLNHSSNILTKASAIIKPWQKQKELSLSSRESFQQFELMEGSLPALLRYEDKNAMSVGVETRLPFLDYKLAEFALALPLEYLTKNGWSKYSLRKAAVHILPAEVVWRNRKLGFEAPQDGWQLKAERFEHLLKKSSLLQYLYPQLHWPSQPKLAWRMLMIALWEKQMLTS
ncbi:asparagine synthase (glutamine-hydrolyzing) [Phnomibacter sp. MR]|uniref:asparagine synthase (glutamine-hydrolyzing) n=1 Tax=Phnomibacter sp. MR TaxID=3042318 RepID=UPI003A80B723